MYLYDFCIEEKLSIHTTTHMKKTWEEYQSIISLDLSLVPSFPTKEYSNKIK